MSKLNEVYKKFLSDFPPEAYDEDNSRGFPLTTLKAQYIVERLNEVCGLDGWALTGEYKEIEEGVLYFGKLTINIDGKEIVRESVGFSKDKKNVGDSYKSARTEALSKAASYLGIGNDMFKGLIVPPKSGGRRQVYKNKSTEKKFGTTANKLKVVEEDEF